mgnify:CR=1 FL=1
MNQLATITAALHNPNHNNINNISSMTTQQQFYNKKQK